MNRIVYVVSIFFKEAVKDGSTFEPIVTVFDNRKAADDYLAIAKENCAKDSHFCEPILDVVPVYSKFDANK